MRQARIYVNHLDEARSLAQINEREPLGDAPENPEADGDPQAGSPYAIDVNAGWRSSLTDMPCTQPPYGDIRASDTLPAGGSGQPHPLRG